MRSLAMTCMLLTTGVAHAGSHEIFAGSSDRALRSTSADALTSDSMGGGQLGYMHRIDAPIDVGGLELWLGGGVEFAGATGTMFQTMSTDIASFAMLGAARARYRLIDHVTASARLALGSTRTALELKDGSGRAFSDSGWGGVASGALGLEITWLERLPVSFGLRCELGYTRTSAPALTPQASAPDDGTLRLPMTTSSFGHLDLSGPFIAFSLLSQF